MLPTHSQRRLVWNKQNQIDSRHVEKCVVYKGTKTEVLMGNNPVMTPAASHLFTTKYLSSFIAAFPLLQTRTASSTCSVMVGTEVHWWSSWLMGETHFRDIMGGFKALLLHRSVRQGPCRYQCFVSHLQPFSIVTQDNFECRVFCSSLQAKQK